jgi:hypothetical protein
MAVSVKKITLWRREVEDRSGALAQVLRPVADAGASLRVTMGYRYPGQEKRGAIEVAPVSGRKATAAAQSAGLAPAGIPALHVEGDDRPGLGHAFASAIAGAGINLSFLVALVTGRRYAAVFGFDSDADAVQAAALIKKAAARSRQAKKR